MAIGDFFKKQILKVPAKAKKQLELARIPFTEEAFLKTISEGKTEAAILFLEAEMNPNAANQDNQTALMLSLSGTETEFASKLVAAGADVNAKDKQSSTALISAARSGNLNAVRFLIDAKANLNYSDPAGFSALMHAIETGHTEIARMLAQAGANVDVRDNTGLTAVMRSVMSGNFDVLQALINAGADVLVKNHETQQTALIMAAQRGQYNLVELLLKNAITSEDRDATDKNGFTALSHSVQNGHTEVVRLLCSKKANAKIADKNGKTPIDYAKERGN